MMDTGRFTPWSYRGVVGTTVFGPAVHQTCRTNMTCLYTNPELGQQPTGPKVLVASSELKN